MLNGQPPVRNVTPLPHDRFAPAHRCRHESIYNMRDVNYVSRKFAAIRSSSAISGATLNSGMFLVVLGGGAESTVPVDGSRVQC